MEEIIRRLLMEDLPSVKAQTSRTTSTAKIRLLLALAEVKDLVAHSPLLDHLVKLVEDPVSISRIRASVMPITFTKRRPPRHKRRKH
jgi:hypothetical protein